MSRWIDIGYKWNTETTYRVREFLKGERFPIQMPFDDMFFQSEYHLPHKAWKWGLKVRKKDRSVPHGPAGEGRPDPRCRKQGY